MSAFRKWLGAALSLVIYAAVSSMLIGIGLIIFSYIWPSTTLAIDRSVVDLIDAIAWPLTVVLVVFFIVSSDSLRAGAREIARRVTALRAGAYEVTFSLETAQKIHLDFSTTLHAFTEQGELAYQRSARTHRVSDHLNAVVRAVLEVSKSLALPNEKGIQKKHIRATVHVPDIVFLESLYQLVDYIPQGAGSGRRFSVRYGAIGISIRSGTNRFYNVADPEHSKEQLISEWGMTDDEAERALKDEFALCLIVRNNNATIVGVVFIKSDKIDNVVGPDVKPEDAKESLSRYLDAIEKCSDCQYGLDNLGKSLDLVHTDLAPSGTFINVYK